MLSPLLIAAAIGYLLGSLPFGYLVARAKGVNIFEVGSKSPGATNVRRMLGRGPGNLVFALDAAKGAAAASWALLRYSGGSVGAEFDNPFSWASFQLAGDICVAAGIAGLVGALVGHSFSCFTRFRGGKGVATGAGGLLVLMPLVLAVSGMVWVVVYYSSGYVSLASVVAVVLLPIAAYFLDQPPLLTGLAIVIAFFVVIRHYSNLRRLVDGTEPKFNGKFGHTGGEPKP